jgi:hypothetical protein
VLEGEGFRRDDQRAALPSRACSGGERLVLREKRAIVASSAFEAATPYRLACGFDEAVDALRLQEGGPGGGAATTSDPRAGSSKSSLTCAA